MNSKPSFTMKRIEFIKNDRVRVSFVHPDLSGDVELAVEFEDSISPTTPMKHIEQRAFHSLIEKFCINLLERVHDDLLFLQEKVQRIE